MKGGAKYIFNLVIIVIIIWLFFASDLTWLKIILAIALAWIIIAQNQLAEFVQKQVVKVADERLPAYRVTVWINPNWQEIVKHLLPESSNAEETNKLMKEELDKAYQVEDSLLRRKFSFVEFCDNVSGMSQIWSEGHKTFVDEMEDSGYFFGFDPKLGNRNRQADKKRDYDLTNRFVIRPEFVGFHTVLPDGEVMEDCKLAKIPYGDIISFFVHDARNKTMAGEMEAVKTFPPKLAAKLKENGVVYDIESYNHEDYGTGTKFNKEKVYKFDDGSEFYDQRMSYHLFKTKYYEIGITIKVF